MFRVHKWGITKESGSGMTETMPSANEGGFSKYSSYETIYETPAKTSRNLENNENEDKSVAITTEAGNQRLDSDSELKAIDPSQGNKNLSKEASTGSSDTVSNNLSNPALCEALVNDWQRLVSDGLPMKKGLSASGAKSKSLPRTLATQTSKMDFAFNLMAEVEWDNIEEKLNNHRLSKIETITPERADQLISSPASFTKLELKEVLPGVHLDKQCTPDPLAEETAKIPGCDAEYWREKFVPSRSRVLRRSSSLPKVQPKKKTFSLPRPRFFLSEENSRSDRPDENKPALRKRLYNATGAWFFGMGFHNKKKQSSQD